MNLKDEVMDLRHKVTVGSEGTRHKVGPRVRDAKSIYERYTANSPSGVAQGEMLV